MTNFERRSKIMLEPTIIENGIKVYRDYICHCEDIHGNNCGRRIPYPTNIGVLKNYKRFGISYFISGHQNIGKNNPHYNKFGEDNSHYGVKHSKEACQRKSAALIGKRHTKKRRKNQSKAQKERFQDPKEIKKLSKAAKKDCVNNPERIERLRKTHIGKPPAKGSGYGKRCHYNSPLQGRVCFRSTYELKYAKYLDKKGILWKYEHKTFELSNCTTYTPDFFLVKNKKYREIKGYMSDSAQEKVDLFQKEYPNRNFKILYKEDLLEKGIPL